MGTVKIIKAVGAKPNEVLDYCIEHHLIDVEVSTEEADRIFTTLVHVYGDITLSTIARTHPN